MPSANFCANARVSSTLPKAWYSWNRAEPSVSFGSPGPRESVRMENTSFFSSSRGANSGMVLW